MGYSKCAFRLSLSIYFFITIITLCIVIRPESLSVNNGISYFADSKETIVLYILAFLVNAIIIWQAAKQIIGNSIIDKFIRFGLRFIAIMYAGLVITPHTILDFEHKIFGSSLFAFELISAGIIAFWLSKSRKNILLFSFALLSGFASLIFLFTNVGFMIESQIIFQLSVWAMFISFLNNYKNKDNQF